MSDDSYSAHLLAQTTAMLEMRRDRLGIVPGGEPDVARRMLHGLVKIGDAIKTYDGRSIEDQVEDMRQLGQAKHLFVDSPAVPRQDRLPHALGRPIEPAPAVIARAKKITDPRQRHAALYGDDPTNALNKHSALNRVWVKK